MQRGWHCVSHGLTSIHSAIPHNMRHCIGAWCPPKWIVIPWITWDLLHIETKKTRTLPLLRSYSLQNTTLSRFVNEKCMAYLGGQSLFSSIPLLFVFLGLSRRSALNWAWSSKLSRRDSSFIFSQIQVSLFSTSIVLIHHIHTNLHMYVCICT